LQALSRRQARSRASIPALGGSHSPTFLHRPADLGLDSLQQELLLRFGPTCIHLIQTEQHLLPPLALQEIADGQGKETASAHTHSARSFVSFLQQSVIYGNGCLHSIASCYTVFPNKTAWRQSE